MRTLLIIGFVWPEPKSSAAGSRMMQLIQFFLDQNYKIIFATTTSKTSNAFDLNSLGIEEKRIELNDSSFDRYVGQLMPNVVLFDRFLTEEQFGWRVAEACPKAIRILDTEDLHFLRKGRQQAYKEGRTFKESDLYNDTAKREIASIYRCDLSLIISEYEMELLQEKFNIISSILHYLPFLLKDGSTKEILPAYEERKHFVTVGTFLHEPNYQAVLLLKNQIWPLIRKKLPQTELHIYGAYSSQKVEQLNNEKEGFIIKGYVDDLPSVMQTYRVCLAYLPFGAGLKGKLIDAMINGVPCAMNDIAAEGMFGDLEPNGYIKNDPFTFAEQAISLYETEEIWESNQQKGFDILRKRFQKDAHEKELLNHLNKLEQALDVHRQKNFLGALLQHHTLQSSKYMGKWIEEKNKITKENS